MTKYQAIRLAKKAQKYPHQLTDDEIMQMYNIMKLVEGMELKDGNKTSEETGD